jgi:DNA modification methylase
VSAPGTSQPWHAEHDVTLYQGHVADVLPTLPAESVNCVVTSPPYYGLRDYGVEGQIGLEASPAEYVETLRAVFAEVRRVLRADGVMWLNLGDSYSGHNGGPSGSEYLVGEKFKAGTPKRTVPGSAKNMLGVPWRVAFALQDDGWTLRNDVIWSKPNAMPESVTDRLATRYEHVFLVSRSRRYWFDLDPIREPSASIEGLTWEQRQARGEIRASRSAEHIGKPGQFAGGTLAGNPLGRNPGDVWTIPTAPYPAAHFATFPPELARRCIAAGCPPDGTVLDPFAGSGTTLMVARRLLRKSIGIELNPTYCELTVDRIGQPIFDFGEASA